MTDEELSDALDGLFAYDNGFTDSGIHDEALRARVIERLRSLSFSAGDEFRLTITRIVRELWMSEKALAQGYGIDDVAGFVKWLAARMEIDL